MSNKNYLESLPEHLRYVGSYKELEIELSTTTDPGLGIVYQDKYVLLLRDPVIFPNGESGTYVRLVEKASIGGRTGTVIVPLADGCIVFVEIFRHATRRWEWELPRGFQEEGLTTAQNAIKETKEELDVEPNSIESLGAIAPNTGMLAGSAEAFIAIMPPGSLPLMKGQKMESIRRIRAVPIVDLDQFLLDHVRCGFSLSAIFLAKLRGKLCQ